MTDQFSQDGTLAYQDLNPGDILDAVESAGFACDGRLLALNSYENRVYQVGLESGGNVVTKFYRPGRWSREQADAAYCVQLKRQNASPANQKINCRGVNLMGVSHGVWKYHAKKRKEYWRAQEEILRKQRINDQFVSPS